MVVGDIVKLKGGGPDMTIEKLSSSKPSFAAGIPSGKIDQAECKWFEKGTPQHGTFKLLALKLSSMEETNESK